MLFKGTERRNARQIAEVMDAVGGQLNAFTSKECTCYYAKVIDEHLPLAMDVLSDMALHSVFDPQEIEKEKGVVAEEIAMVEDSPEDLVNELLMDAQFGDQPLAWPILGSEENVRGFTRQHLFDFGRAHYRPERAVLAIAGNFDWEQLKALTEDKFGAWEQKPLSLPAYATLSVPPKAVRREKDIEQLHICLGFPGLAQGSEGIYPLSIFNTVFGGAMSSRLFQKIREEEGMAYSVYTYPSTYLDCGLYAIYAGTSKDHAQRVMDLLRAEIDEMLKNGLTRAEFETAREQLKGSYTLGMESTSSRMNAIGRRKLLMGSTQTESDVIQKINAIQYEDVQQVIRKILDAPCSAALVGRGAQSVDLAAFGLE